MTQNTSCSTGKGVESSNRCSSRKRKKNIKQLRLAPGSTTDLLGLLNLRHLRLRRDVLAAEPIPGHELQRGSSRCCCSSSHHFAFSLSGSLCLPLPLPGLQQHSALMHTFSAVSVPAAQKLTWLLSKHREADKLKEKQEISFAMNECLFLIRFPKLPFLIPPALPGLKQWSSLPFWIPQVLQTSRCWIKQGFSF